MGLTHRIGASGSGRRSHLTRNILVVTAGDRLHRGTAADEAAAGEGARHRGEHSLLTAVARGVHIGDVVAGGAHLRIRRHHRRGAYAKESGHGGFLVRASARSPGAAGSASSGSSSRAWPRRPDRWRSRRAACWPRRPARCHPTGSPGCSAGCWPSSRPSPGRLRHRSHRRGSARPVAWAGHRHTRWCWRQPIHPASRPWP